MLDALKKLFSLLSAAEKKKLGLIFLGSLLLAFVEVLGIASIMPFMAVVSNPDYIHSNKYLSYVYDFLSFTSNGNFLTFLGSIVLVFLVFSNLFKAFMNWMTLKFDNFMYCMFAERLLACYLKKPYVFFLNRNTADLGKNILNEARTVVAGVLMPGVRFFSGALVSCAILSLLLVVQPVVAGTIFLVLGGTYSILFFSVKRFLRRIGKEQVFANFMKFKFAGEALSGIKDLKVLGREAVFHEKFSLYARRHARNNVRAGLIGQLPKYFIEILAFGGILLIVLHFLSVGNSTVQVVPLLALYAFAGYRLLPALQQVFSNISTIRYSIASLDVLYADLYENKPHSDLVDSSQTNRPHILPFSRKLEFSQVSFHYPNSEKPAIDRVNLTILPKTTVGLVGTTGSGKTTLVDILLGLLMPTSGALLVDDVVVDSATVKSWQSNLGYVPQHIYLADDTLARNIAFGIPDDQIDKDAVVRSAKVANLQEFVETDLLPDTYETVIGERGVRLSGGQRQRIGIARALYHDPSVLVMDEATSALDGITESAVMEAIKHLTGEKTIILIAHRLSTLKDCDIIYQLDQGRVINQGTYAELQKSSEWFIAAAKETT